MKINEDTYLRINGCFNDVIGKTMKEHQMQIQSIIEHTLANPLIHFNESVTQVRIGDESYVNDNIDSEHANQQFSNRNEQFEHLSSAMSNNNTQTVSQLYANEQSELKYLLIREELTKRQIILDEVLLINEALKIKIAEYEVDNLKLPPVKKPTNVTHSSVQTDVSMELVENRKRQLLPAATVLNENRRHEQNLEKVAALETVESVNEKQIASNLSVVSNKTNKQHDHLITLKETICKLKIGEQRRKKRLEKLVLKNFTLKLEICELKKEIKKYSSIWANDRYFNSLFLDATKLTLAK